MAQDEERTEKATPKRREEARKRGELAQSREVTSNLILLAALLAALSALGAGLALSLAAGGRAAWSGALVRPESLGDYHALILYYGFQVSRLLVPLLVALMVAGVVGNVIQTGALFTFEPLSPRLDRISLLKGVKRMFSADRLFDLLKAFVKIAVAGAATWFVLGPAMESILSLTGSDLMTGLALAGSLVVRLAIAMLIAFTLFAILDLLWVRWRYEKKLRMTKQEVRDETKQREGDPKLKARVRALQRELSRHRMIAEVGKADVVIANPTHYAVAMSYVRDAMSAPRVVAKGRNHLAQRIRREARIHGVPIVENPPLAQLLYRTAPLGRDIPESLYQAVAEVLAYITRLDPRRGRAWGAAS